MACCGARAAAVCSRDRLLFRLEGRSWQEVYSTPVWGSCSPTALLGLRLAIFFAWVACCCWSFAAMHKYLGKWFTYLTHWSALLEVFYFGFAAYATFRATRGGGVEEEAREVKAGGALSTPWFVRVTWVLFGMVPTVSLTILLLFWTLVYNPAKKLEALSVVMHGFNYLLVLLDFLVFHQPFYLTHIFIPVLLGVAYAVFSLLYFLGGGLDPTGQPFIYAVLDWRKAASTVVMLLIIIFILLPILYLVNLCIGGRVCCAATVATKAAPNQLKEPDERAQAELAGSDETVVHDFA